MLHICYAITLFCSSKTKVTRVVLIKCLLTCKSFRWQRNKGCAGDSGSPSPGHQRWDAWAGVVDGRGSPGLSSRYRGSPHTSASPTPALQVPQSQLTVYHIKWLNKYDIIIYGYCLLLVKQEILRLQKLSRCYIIMKTLC